MTLPAGTRLGPYEILAPIGAGGMGEVYRARDEKLGRDLAIKVLPESDLGDSAARARLLREARSAASLNHPNVCTIHEVGEADGRVFIAMELVEGSPLDARIPAEGLPVERVLDYGLQIAEAVAHAHERGIVHRDLKPSNAIVTPQGRVKVLDFGLAKQVVPGDTGEEDTASHATLTQAGAVVGTLPYMAPEQLRGEPADARSDVWALGVVLYEMACGSRPFRGQTGFDLSAAILTKPPAPMPEGVAGELAAVIARCLEKEPSRRYQRGGEAHAALQALATGSVAPSLAGHAWPRRRWLAMAGAAAAVLLVSAVVWTGRARERSSAPIKLAVLPFANPSGDAEQEYFSDGLTEETIAQLGRLHPGRLGVIARASAMRYKKTDKTIREIGGELGVDYVLEGSARREGSRVRVTAELIAVRDQTQVWAETYERELAGILALQSDLARGVARSLALKLLPAEERSLDAARPVDPEAFEACLKGREHQSRLTAPDLDAALRYYERALEIDPNSALAYAGISGVWGARQQMVLVAPQEATPKSKAAALKALELDAALPEVHYRLAAIKTWSDWDWAGGEAAFRRALALNPNYPEARALYSHLLQILKRPEEAMPQIERALELDPFGALVRALYGVNLNIVQRPDDAVGEFQTVLKTVPRMLLALNGLQQAYWQKGMYEDAFVAERSARIARGDDELVAALDRGHAEGGYQGAMRRAADALAARSPTSGRALIAALYMRAGETDRALEWLERAYEGRDPNLPYLNVNPVYDPVRSAPRFQDLLRRMKLPG